MQSAIRTLEHLLSLGEKYFLETDEISLTKPRLEGKWSRKQILGHLIDSGLNNLQRFTEIGYHPQPYIYREYNQDELVAVNDYQNADATELLQLWLSLNKQIVRVMQAVSEERLNLKVQFTDGSISDLRYLMYDYPGHLEHHIKQIVN